MPKTLSGTYTVDGYTLTGSSQGLLNPITVTGSIAIGSGLIPAALYGHAANNAWIVTNLGTIPGGTAAAIGLFSGGTVVNAASGMLDGHFGVAVQHGTGSVTNTGTIIANTPGTKAAATEAIGVVLMAGGSVANQAPGQIAGQAAGVAIYVDAGTVTNTGLISGAQDGVYLSNGRVTNQSHGDITGGWGIVVQKTGGVLNTGTISGTTQGGLLLVGGGAVTHEGSIGGGL